MLPVPLAAQNYGLSATSIDVRTYAIGTAVGLIVPVLLWTSLGAVGREVVTGTPEPWYFVALGLALVPAALVFVRLRRRLQQIT